MKHCAWYDKYFTLQMKHLVYHIKRLCYRMVSGIPMSWAIPTDFRLASGVCLGKEIIVELWRRNVWNFRNCGRLTKLVLFWAESLICGFQIRLLNCGYDLKVVATNGNTLCSVHLQSCEGPMVSAFTFQLSVGHVTSCHSKFRFEVPSQGRLLKHQRLLRKTYAWVGTLHRLHTSFFAAYSPYSSETCLNFGDLWGTYSLWQVDGLGSQWHWRRIWFAVRQLLQEDSLELVPCLKLGHKRQLCILAACSKSLGVRKGVPRRVESCQASVCDPLLVGFSAGLNIPKKPYTTSQLAPTNVFMEITQGPSESRTWDCRFWGTLHGLMLYV